MSADQGPMRVLVVDDNADLRESLAMVLSALGHDVIVADSGPRALEEIALHRPDVVLLDVGMPGMSGYEVATRARQHPAGATPILVAMTGWARDEDRERALAAGFDHHVVKPLGLEALQALFASLRRPAPGA